MQLYNVKIRLGGNVANEVRKEDVTAAEIEILREMHGQDAVGDIVTTEKVNRSSVDERARLMAIYVNPEHNNAERMKQKTEMFRTLFGNANADLPTKLAEEVPAAPEKPKRTKVEAATAGAKELIGALA